MSAIRKLPASVVSQIAAGEIIERPASALKELLENSRDGGARRIEIDIGEGGIRRLAVKDDGCGISAADLPLAVSPHATSKIAALADLDGLATMGFRGEALASIAAVASVTVRSRTAGSDNGHELALRGEYGGETPRPVPAAFGTEVIVEDLFARLPVRRKFMRRPPTEWAHCEGVAAAFALSCPEIEIVVSRDGKQRRRWRGQSRRERVDAVYGPRFAEQARRGEFSLGPLHAEAFIATGMPAAGRNKVILNGRVLSDRLLRQAVRKGAADVSRESEPAYAVFLSMPAPMADVNAHPAKTEVRFREPQAIFKFVLDAVAAAVAAPLGPPRKITVAASNRPQPTAAATLPIAPVALQRPPASAPPVPEASPPAAAAEQLQQVMRKLGRPVGQIHGVYLLCEAEEGMVIIDIHAAHERLLYEKLKRAAAASAPARQALLEPAPVDLSPEGLDAAESARAALAELGFDLRNDDGAEMLHALPADLSKADADPARLAAAMIEQMAETGVASAADQLRDQILSSAACHLALRGKIPQLGQEQMQALLRDMELTMRSGVCNHGRPCWQLLEISQLDRMFERGR